MIMNRLPSLSNERRMQDEHFGHYHGDVQSFSQPYSNQYGSPERGHISGPAFDHNVNAASHQAMYDYKMNTRETSDGPVATDANLYIKNIDYDISDEVLYTIFSKIGEITSHHIVRDAMKRSRGFGFMSYRTIEQAKRAILEANGMFIGNKPVVVMLHIKKDQRRLQKLVMKETLGNGHAGQPRPGPYNLQQAMHLYQSNHMQGAPHHQTPGHSTGPFGIMRRSGHGPNSGPLTGPYANQNLRTNAYNGRDNVYNNERSEYDLIDAAEYGQQMRKLPYASREPVWDGYKSPHGHHDSESYRYPNSSKPASPQGSQRSEQFEADLFAQRERREQLQYEQLRSPHSAKPNSNLWSGSSDREIESNQDVSSVQDQLQWLELGSPSKSLSKSSLSPSISEHGNWTTNSSPKCVQSTPIFDNVFGSYPPANHSKTSRPVGPESGVGYPSNGDQMLPEINLASRRPSYISIDERLERNYERTQLFAPTSGPFTTDSGSHRPHSPVVARPAGLSVNTNFANSNSLSLLTDPSQIYQVSARLLQLIEVQTPIGSARKITDYLVQHAPHSELLQLLENPDLLLSHYIAAAISKMGHSRN